jgi:hypothetical protein
LTKSRACSGDLYLPAQTKLFQLAGNCFWREGLEAAFGAEQGVDIGEFDFSKIEIVGIPIGAIVPTQHQPHLGV